MVKIQTLINRFKTTPKQLTVLELRRIITNKKISVGKIRRKGQLIRAIKLHRSKKAALIKKATDIGIATKKKDTKKTLINNILSFYNKAIPAIGTDTIKSLQEFGIHRRVRITIGKNINTLKAFYKHIMKYINQSRKQPETDIKSVILFYKILGTTKLKNQYKHTSISADELRLFRSFKKRIVDQEADAVEGSDATPKETHRLDTQIFDLLIRKGIRGGGKDISHIYNTEKIKSNGLCGYEALKILLGDSLKCTKKQYMSKKLFILDNLINYININDLKISIIADTINLNEGFTEYCWTNPNYTEIVQKSRTIFLNKIGAEHISLIYLYNGHDDNKKILFNVASEHYDVLKKIDGTYLKDIYCAVDKRLFEKINNEYHYIENFEQNYKKQTKIGTRKNPTIKEEYIFIDYEGVVNWNHASITVPYSIAFMHCNLKELQSLTKADEKNNQKAVDKFIKRHCHFQLGFGCTRFLYDYILKHGKNKKFTIITFNGVNYDNFLLYKDLKEIDKECVSKPFYNGTRLMNFKIWGKHDLYDIRKHVIGSLSSNCSAFKINICSKQTFSHIDAQKLYDSNELIRTFNQKDYHALLKKYNIYDVVSLGVLFCKYRTTITNIPGFEWLDSEFEHYKTIGSLMMKQIKQYWESAHLDIQNYKVKGKKKQATFIKLYNDLNKYKSGGRVQLFNGVLPPILERLSSLDVCSLYPFVMMILNIYYPTGKIILTKKYKKNKMGFYYCDIDQSPLRKKGLPMIICEKTKIKNNWDTKIILEDYLISSIKIKQLQDYGADVTIKNGFYFSDKVKSFEMFKPLLPLMQMKNKEDINKLAGKEYNTILREILKLMMNCISGKMIEGLHLDTVTELKTYDLLKLEQTKKVNIINFDSKCITVSYKKNQTEVMSKSRPIHIGVLIYDYAQNYMYDTQYSKFKYDKLIYTDTDSNKIKYPDFTKWYEEYAKNTIVPHWEEVEEIDPRYKTHKLFEKGSKVFGSYEDEYPESNYKHYFLAKKCYLSLYAGGGKMTFKGVGARDSIIYNDEEGDYIMTEDNKKKYLGETNKELYYDYASASKLYVEGKYDNREELFKQLYENKKAKILTQCFNRSVKNMAHNTSKDGKYDKKKVNKNNNSIIINTRIKRLKI